MRRSGAPIRMKVATVSDAIRTRTYVVRRSGRARYSVSVWKRRSREIRAGACEATKTEISSWVVSG